MANVVIFTGYRTSPTPGHKKNGYPITITPPAGAYRMRTYLEDHGYSTLVVNFVHLWSDDEILAILSKQTDLLVIGVSTTFYEIEERLLPMIKRNFPAIPLVLGGPDPRPERQAGIEVVDRIFYGGSEVAFVAYLDHLTGKRDEDLPWSIHPDTQTPYIIADKTLPYTNTVDLHITWKPEDHLHGIALPIEISRGCIFRCSFCAFPLVGKKKLDYIRSADSLADEFRRNYEMFGTTVYSFMDDTFNDTTTKLELVQQAIKQAGVKLQFCCYLRADLLAAFPEQMDLLLEMGLISGVLGIESMNEAARKAIGKGFSNEKLLRTLETFKDKSPNRQLRLASGFIIGLPGETLDSIMETHRWLNEQSGRYLDFWNWAPLFIPRKNMWLNSEFSRNAERYGYKFRDDTIRWYTNIMTYKTAEKLSIALNLDRHDIRPAEFTLNEYLSYGFSLEELCTTSYDKFNTIYHADLLRRRETIVAAYKARLLDNLSEQHTVVVIDRLS